jgi:hypothetical protein
MYGKFGRFIRITENGKRSVITNTSFVAWFRNQNCHCLYVAGNVSEAKLGLKIYSGKGDRFRSNPLIEIHQYHPARHTVTDLAVLQK